MLSARGLTSPFLSATTARGYRATSMNTSLRNLDKQTVAANIGIRLVWGSPFASSLLKRTKERSAFRANLEKEAPFGSRCRLAISPERTRWAIHNRLTSSGLGSPITPGREVPTVFTVREDKDQAPNKSPTSDFSSFNSF